MGFFAALVAAVPALAVYLFFGQMSVILVLFLALPPLMIGYAAQFVGRCYKIKHRLPIGVLGASAHIFGCVVLQVHPFYYLLTPIAFMLSVMVAKVKLKRVDIWAIEEYEMGKINIPQ
ncbi:MAG: hypothetical protein DWP95_02040 [Proteobacteria bacterium]|nr:MAG: hypothetical protein DWP95_02040 [Pseudomonadota bacterium]